MWGEEGAVTSRARQARPGRGTGAATSVLAGGAGGADDGYAVAADLGQVHGALVLVSVCHLTG